MGGPNTRAWGIVGEEGQARSASQLGVINFRARMILKGQVHRIRATPGIGDRVASLEMASFLAQSKSHGQYLAAPTLSRRNWDATCLHAKGMTDRMGKPRGKGGHSKYFHLSPLLSGSLTVSLDPSLKLWRM